MRSLRFYRRIVVTPLILVAFSPVAEAAAGRVTFTSGGAYIERGPQKLAARKDMLLEVGDVMVTENDGRLQWRMADDSYFAIRPGSRFKVDEFNEPASTGGGKAYYSLLKGGFRSITGLIGKGDASAYKVTSPVATMGIRGTDHTHVLCQSDCGWAPGGNVQDGLYTRVDDGDSVLSNADGTLDVGAGSYAMTASPPKPLSSMPSVFATWDIDFSFHLAGTGFGAETEGTIRIEPPSPH